MSEKEMNELMEKLLRLEGQLRRYQVYGMRMFGPWVNPHRGQGRVLSLLKMQPEISQKELSYLLDMRQQSLSELLAKLEQKGYIIRKPSEEDRRTTLISLTEEGKAAAEQGEYGEMDLNRVFNCLTPEEQTRLSGYLDRLADEIEKETRDMGFNWKNFSAGMGWGGEGPAPDDCGRGFGARWGFGGGRHGAGPAGRGPAPWQGGPGEGGAPEQDAGDNVPPAGSPDGAGKGNEG